MQGICSASSLEAAASEPDGVDRHNTASHQLHSVLIAAHTGQCLAKVQPGSSLAYCFGIVSKSAIMPHCQWPDTGSYAAGAAVQQMWGAQWRAYTAETAEVSSLDALVDADLSPIQALLDSCILAPLLERVRLRLTLLHCLSKPITADTSATLLFLWLLLGLQRSQRRTKPQADRSRQALMEQLTGAWAVQQHLEALWRTLLLASPAMQPFLGTVQDMLASSDRDDIELRAIDLQRALEMAMSDAEDGSLLPCSSLRGAEEVCVHLFNSADHGQS